MASEVDSTNPLDFLSSRKGTQLLPGGGYSPFQGSIHSKPGSEGAYEGWPCQWLLGSDLAPTLARMSIGLLLPALEGDGSVRPGDGSVRPGDGSVRPGDGSVRPGDGSVHPGGVNLSARKIRTGGLR